MKIRFEDTLVYTETIKDWGALEEAYVDHMASQSCFEISLDWARASIVCAYSS